MYWKLSYCRCSLCIKVLISHLYLYYIDVVCFSQPFYFCLYFIFYLFKIQNITQSMRLLPFAFSSFLHTAILFRFSKCVSIVTDQQKYHKKLCALDLINLKRNSYSLQYHDDKNLPYLIVALLWILRIWIEINTSSVNVLWRRPKTYILYVICFCLFLGR